jgi:hypothetical protein
VNEIQDYFFLVQIANRVEESIAGQITMRSTCLIYYLLCILYVVAFCVEVVQKPRMARFWSTYLVTRVSFKGVPRYQLGTKGTNVGTNYFCRRDTSSK